MYIFGASGHAKAILDLLEEGKLVKAIFDDDYKIKSLLGIEVISPIPELLPNDDSFIIAIGNNQIRKNIADTLLIDHEFVNVIHKSAILSKHISFGLGNVIMESSIIKVGSSIGDHVIVNTNASIDHDCIIEDFVHIAPSSTLCGGVKVGEGSLIGAGSVVLPNINIGKWCIIAAGSRVHQSISDGQTWIGESLKKK